MSSETMEETFVKLAASLERLADGLDREALRKEAAEAESSASALDYGKVSTTHTPGGRDPLTSFLLS